MRNASKNKFLTCFRPVDDDTDDMLQPRAAVDRSSSRRFSCIPVADKSSATKSTFSEQELPQNLVVSPKPPLSKVIKAMLIETLLVSLLFSFYLFSFYT